MSARQRGLGSVYRRKKRMSDGTAVELPKMVDQVLPQRQSLPGANGHREVFPRPQEAEEPHSRDRRRGVRRAEGGPASNHRTPRRSLGPLPGQQQVLSRLCKTSGLTSLAPPFQCAPCARPRHAQRTSVSAQETRGGRGQRHHQPRVRAPESRLQSCPAPDPAEDQVCPYIPRLVENNLRKGFLEYTQFAALHEAIGEDIRRILTFAYYTGCRLGEILSLKWSQVELGGRIVRLEPGETKNKEARHLVMVPDLYLSLAVQKTIRDEKYPACPWVFFRYATGKRVRDFRGAWATACDSAGLVARGSRQEFSTISAGQESATWCAPGCPRPSP